MVERVYGDRPNVDSARPIEGTKIQVKDDEKSDPALDTLKQKILVEKTTAEPESGLLFFPLAKEKPKNLILSCNTAATQAQTELQVKSVGREKQKGEAAAIATSPA